VKVYMCIFLRPNLSRQPSPSPAPSSPQIPNTIPSSLTNPAPALAQRAHESFPGEDESDDEDDMDGGRIQLELCASKEAKTSTKLALL
jgi:hypothetical protein